MTKFNERERYLCGKIGPAGGALATVGLSAALLLTQLALPSASAAPPCGPRCGSETPPAKACRAQNCPPRSCPTAATPQGCCPERAAANCPERRDGKVLIVRGLFTVFSLGLDDLGRQLRAKGVDTEVVPSSLSFSAASQIGDDYKAGRVSGPIVLVGHSLGGDLAPHLANYLRDSGVPVKLCLLIDSNHPGRIPANVTRAVHIYQSNASPEWFPLFRGVPLEREACRTEVVNFDIRQSPARNHVRRLDHFDIEESPYIQDLVRSEILRACPLRSANTAQPATALGRVEQTSGAGRIATAAPESSRAQQVTCLKPSSPTRRDCKQRCGHHDRKDGTCRTPTGR